ncbi:MAG: radical SAM family heme chaperone HemW [Woeseiaceae bacterium]
MRAVIAVRRFESWPASSMTSSSDIPLSLYVHLPWCVRKCPYCDFNSYSMGNDAPREQYLEALLRDLEPESARAGGRELVSVFLGGGTPSVFSPGQIARLLDGIRAGFSLRADVEITMEANPGTVECGDPRGYREAGVNRLSIGAQSFTAAALETLGRIHSVDDISRAVDEARVAGFENINIDLMYGLPGQGVKAALFDIEQAAALQPEHLSWYQLTLEPNTVFHARPPAGLPGQELSMEIQDRGQDRLTGLGYEQYEVSAWAKDRKRCRHNLNYWSFGDYLAVGAGAHGKISGPAGIWRYTKPANPRQFMATAGEAAELREVTTEDRLFEFMLNVLRLNAAFSAAQFSARTGLAETLLRDRLARPVEKGLIEELPQNSWQVTAFGRRFLNDLQADFLPD